MAPARPVTDPYRKQDYGKILSTFASKGDKIPFQHWLRSCTISNIVLSDLYGSWYNKRRDPLMLCLTELGRQHLTSVQV